jgi:hypothetical protein
MKEIRPTFGSSVSYPQVSQRYMAVDVGLWGRDSTRTSCTSGTTDSCRHMKHPTHSVINDVALESRCHFRSIYHNPFITSILIHITNQNGHHDNRGPTQPYAKSRSMLFYKALDSKLLGGRTPLTLEKDWSESNSRLAISRRFLTARQTASSSLGAVYSTLDDFSSRAPAAHLPCEKSCRNLQSYTECVSLRPVRI